MSSEEVKRPRGRPRKIAFGDPNVPPPRLVVPAAPVPELRLSKAHRALIQSLAREARISPATVLDDIINHGIPQAREMYKDLIECRQRLEHKHNDERRNERPLQKTTDLGTEGNGRAAVEFDSGLGSEHHAFDVGPGLEGEGEAAVAAYSPDDNVLM